MLQLPDRVERTTETPLVRRCLITLNRLPGVRVMRNNSGKSPCACPPCRARLCRRCFPRLVRPIAFGLGYGSPDIVGLITIGATLPIGVAFGLEVKVAERRANHKEARKRQGAWRGAAIRRGMLCDEVTSEAEAVAAVEGFRVEMTRRVLVLP